MPLNPSAGDSAHQREASFACRWRLEGSDAASVRVAGEVDLATAGKFRGALLEALGYARLVLLDLHAVSFMDSTGLHVILDAVAQASARGARVVLAGASAQVQSLLTHTETEAHLDVLKVQPSQGAASPVEHVARNGWTPFDNAVNDRVLPARVMAVSDAELWIQAADGSIHRPWAPPAVGPPVPAGTEVEIYLDDTGAMNGWHEPLSGFAINQRGLEPGSSPATHGDLACQGPCGLVWLAPAAARLAEGDERCLTCAGVLVPR